MKKSLVVEQATAREREESLREALARDWDILEWGTGSGGLEAVFRRLTLGEERQTLRMLLVK